MGQGAIEARPAFREDLAPTQGRSRNNLRDATLRAGNKAANAARWLECPKGKRRPKVRLRVSDNE
jgi:hypothetical protein